MKKITRLSVIVVWAALIYTLFRLNLITGNMSNINQFIENCGKYKEIIFIGLSSLRIAALIPSSVFMLLGGMVFNPLEGFCLTLISVILSETIVYYISRKLLGSKLHDYMINKYPKLYGLLSKNSTKILYIGILCPVAPSDVACFLASSTGLSYGKFIKTVIIGNLPMMILYSFLGNSIISSGLNTVVILSIIILISLYSIYIWRREQTQQSLA